jgi:hypothetical protein
VRGINPPAIDYRALYKKAITQTQGNADKAVLAGLEDRMVAAGVAYDATIQAHGPHMIVQIPLTAREDALVRVLYEKRIVAKSGACRSTYDDIYVSTASCPFCLDGEIYEVDHFLPQAHHHDVVMYPGNLVPICHACNHIKLELRPVDARRSLLHPYFDRLPAQPWLFAQLNRKADGPVLNYWVHLNEAQHGNIAPRLEYHFATLQLDRRMRVRSAKVLVELQADVEGYLADLGADGLKAHFASEAAKHYNRHGNTLEAAAYRAASVNDAFCAGEYKN